MSDSLQQKQAAAEARRRSGRQRICMTCVRAADVEIGLVYSELPCSRCGKAPCHGIVTAGPIPIRGE